MRSAACARGHSRQAGAVPRGLSRRRRHRRSGSRSPRQLRRHSLRSPITGSSRTAIPERSSHPTAPSIGSACRASTRRASSAACSIARPGPSGWGRSGSTSPPPGATSRGRTRWQPPGTRRPAGFWSATRSPWVRETARTRSRPTRAHRQTTTPTTCWYVPCSASREASKSSSSASPCSTMDERRRQWSLVEGDRHVADATGAEQTVRLRTDMALGIEGDTVRARHTLTKGEQAYCSLSWADRLVSPENVDQANARLAATTRFWRAWLGRAFLPDHRFRDPVQRSALTIKGLTYMPTGATVAALTTSLPETPGGRTQLGLSLHLDPRRDLHLAGAPISEPRLGSRPVRAIRRRSGAERGRCAADHVRDRRQTRPHRVHARRAVRLRRGETGAGRKRRLRPAPERRLRRGPRLDPPAHTTLRAPAEKAVADRPVTGRVCKRSVEEAGPRDLGGPRQAPALRLLEADVLGGPGPCVEARRDSRRSRARARMGCDCG